MTILTDELLAAFEDSIGDVNRSRILPPVLYTSEEFYEFEKEAVFAHDWLCLGRSSRIRNPGDYFTLTIVDEPLIVVRTKDGTIRVLSAVCRHRAMVVADDFGNCTKFTCPYHLWTYGLDGRLLGTPAMERAEGFRKSDHPLPQLKVEEWQGFIFANFDLDAPPLAPTVTKVDDYAKNFDLEHAVSPPTQPLNDLPWNWKVMFENFNDAYHANRLHKGRHDFCPSENAEFTSWDDADNAVVRTNRFTHIDAGFNATGKALLPIWPGITEEERWRVTFTLVPPTLCMGFAPDEVFYFIVLPQGPQSISIDIGYCFHPDAIKHPLFDLLFDESNEGVKIFNDQDVYADTMVQRGLRSRFAQRGRYSYQEETHRQLNRWLVRRYQKYWPTSVAESGRPAAMQVTR
jgi:phenylpropionate dioxygenase-like ring-hydroxylating dioxygenase large terminal subunit